jgi:UDP-N-acetylmuramate dehydrogenase
VLDKRWGSQQFEHPSAGCFFRNPPHPHPPAGKLLDSAGLRGYRVGGAEFSEAHANFLVNRGGATVPDILELLATAVVRVRDETGIELRPEVKLLGRQGWVDPLVP